jgi:hypothetical protein
VSTSSARGLPKSFWFSTLEMTRGSNFNFLFPFFLRFSMWYGKHRQSPDLPDPGPSMLDVSPHYPDLSTLRYCQKCWVFAGSVNIAICLKIMTWFNWFNYPSPRFTQLSTFSTPFLALDPLP